MRILVATDQPYWKCRGGAHQRIRCLLDGLRHLGPLQVTTFYLGDPSLLPEKDKVATIGPIVSPRARDERWWKGGWFRNTREGTGSGDSHRPSDPPRPLSLDDYRWEWVFPGFRQTVRRFQPDVILMEYVTMAYLRQAVDSSSIVWALDTHDLLFRRCAQFAEHGQTHWLSISRDEEIAAWQNADVLIAIQPDEAQFLQTAVPKAQTVVCGHTERLSPTWQESTPVEPDWAQRDPDRIKFGLIASDNFPNRQALEFLIKEVAPRFLQQSPSAARSRLLVAGSLCHAIPDPSENPEVAQWLEPVGMLEDLETFYRTIDVALNPVATGTGLKIKSSEALVRGVPQLVSDHVAEGFGQQPVPWVVCRDRDQWCKEMIRVVTDQDWRQQVAKEAEAYAASQMSVETVYGPLNRVLRRMVGSDSEPRVSG